MREARVQPLDRAVVAGAALAAGGVATVAPWQVVGVAAGVLALAWAARRADAVTVILTVALLGFGLLRGHLAVARHEQARAWADLAIPQPARCSALATVDGSPVRVREVLRWDAHLADVVCDGASAAWAGRATLYGGPDDLARGDRAEIVATLAPPQRLWDAGTGDPRPSEARRAVLRTGGALDVRVVRRARTLAAWIDRERSRLRRRIEATFAPDVAPMARALVLGESDLAAADDQSFRASGLSHLLAVSGMHLVLVLALVVRVLQGVLVRVEAIAARTDAGRLSALIGIPAAWVYADIAGGGGSRVRPVGLGHGARRSAGSIRPLVRALGGGHGGPSRVRPAARAGAGVTRARAPRGRDACHRHDAGGLGPVRAHPGPVRAHDAARGRDRQPRGGAAGGVGRPSSLPRARAARRVAGGRARMRGRGVRGAAARARHGAPLLGPGPHGRRAAAHPLAIRGAPGGDGRGGLAVARARRLRRPRRRRDSLARGRRQAGGGAARAPARHLPRCRSGRLRDRGPARRRRDGRRRRGPRR